MKIANESEAIEAMEKLHGKGVRAVVITSTDLYGVPGELALLASHKPAHADGGPARRFRVRMPALAGYFTGTGDLFAAVRTRTTAHAQPHTHTTHRDLA